MNTNVDLGQIPATGWLALGVLSFNEELSGYDIKRWSDQSIAFFYSSPSQSQIYGELQRLEKLGLASSRLDHTHNTRVRRLFQITTLGQQAMREWMQKLQVEQVTLKHPLILRLWAAHNGGPEKLIPAFEDRLESLKAEIAKIQGHIKNARHRPDWTYAVIALEWSERQRLAEIDNLQWVIQRIKKISVHPHTAGDEH